jgi:hypothetical protein
VSKAIAMQFVPVAADIVAVVILAYALYFRRYYRRDLLLAYVSLNVGVLAVTWVLVSSNAGVGLGLGLFGVLSIIRLRSDTVTQEEIAYYFVALALGLLGGVRAAPPWLGPGLSTVLLLVMYVVDHPRLFRGVRRQIVTLDAAYTDERLLREALSRLLGGQPRHLVVIEIDLVHDITKVDVRYRVAGRGIVRRSPERAEWADRAAP